MNRTSHRLVAKATGMEMETRIRCQDDNHQPGAYNPWLNATFCHCGRIRYPGHVEQDRWPDRDARLTEHVDNPQ